MRATAAATARTAPRGCAQVSIEHPLESALGLLRSLTDGMGASGLPTVELEDALAALEARAAQ